MAEAVMAILGAWVLTSVVAAVLIITFRSWVDHRQRESAREQAPVRMAGRRQAG